MEIKPTYVTFEQAKLLKEKGFDEACANAYFCYTNSICELLYPNPEIFGYNYLFQNSVDFNKNENPNSITNNNCAAPEQWQVIEWLRIKHGIWISIQQDVDKYDAYIKNKKYDRTKVQHVTNQFDTPQKATSAAFDYTLRNYNEDNIS